MFRRFGSRVTVIGQREQILTPQDPDMAIAVQTLLERDGIDFLLKSKVLWIDRAGKETILQAQASDHEVSLQGSHLLVAVGRAPTTDTITLFNHSKQKKRGAGTDSVRAQPDSRTDSSAR